MSKQRTIQTGKMVRAGEILGVRVAADGTLPEDGERRIELAFSSELPVRRFFGDEVLGHKRGEISLDWFSGGTAPLLVDHNQSDVVGVVEKVSLGGDRVGRAIVRLGKSARAGDIWADIADGIRSNVSVGYRIDELTLVKKGGDAGNEAPVYRATKWTPLEISIVSVPADMTVGVGRSDQAGDFSTIIHEEKDAMEPNTQVVTAPVVVPPVVVPAEVRTAPPAPSVDDVMRGERDRVREITALGRRFNRADLAETHIGAGTALEVFRGLILSELPAAQAIAANPNHLGLSGRELKKFSLMRVIQAATFGRDNPAVAQAAGFEMELSQEVARKVGKEPRGYFMPLDLRMMMSAQAVAAQMMANGPASQSVFRGMQPSYAQLPLALARDLTSTGSATGQEFVATDLMDDMFIDLLYNAVVCRGLGATVLSGLQGNIAIPKVTAGVTAAWVAENAAPSETTPATGSLSMSAKTVTGYVELSRRLIIQSSPSVENFVRNDLISAIGVGIDTAAIAGTGSSNQPTGILNTAGIGAVALGTNGAVLTWAAVVNNEKEVAIDNANSGRLAYLTNPRVVAQAKTTGKQASGVEGNFILNPDTVNGGLNGHGYAVTNSVPNTLTKGASGAVCSALIFGNFADLIIAEWGGLDVLVNPYADTTKGQVRVSAFLEADIGVRRAQSFSATQDVLAG